MCHWPLPSDKICLLICDGPIFALHSSVRRTAIVGTIIAHALFFLFVLNSLGKNWDFTAALSDFEQLRQVHAVNLTYSFTEERSFLPSKKEMARVGRPVLQRQEEVVQGEVLG